MKKNTVLYILLIFLIAVNAFFIVQQFKQPSKKMRKSPKEFISKRLQFDEEQINQFNELEKQHRERMRAISHETKELKDALFDKINDVGIADREIDSITSLIGALEKQKDIEVFNHFRNISSFCTDEQKIQLVEILKKARRRGKGRPPGPPKHRK